MLKFLKNIISIPSEFIINIKKAYSRTSAPTISSTSKMVTTLIKPFDKPETSIEKATPLIRPYEDKKSKRSIYDLLPAISRIERSHAIPLSDNQFRLAFLEQMSTDFSIYNWLMCFTIKGVLNVNALEKSIRYLIKRHESLRTGLNIDANTQIIINEEEVNWSLEFLKIRDELDNESIAAQCHEYAQTKFNLTKPPLLRSKLLQYADGEENTYLWLCVIHHSVIDDASQAIFLQELATCYKYFCLYPKMAFVPSLPSLPLQYADYSCWAKKNLADIKRRQLLYWDNKLKGASSLELPTDFPRPSVKSFKGERVQLNINKDDQSTLMLLADYYDTSLFCILLASFACLLHRYSGQEDICIGTMTANRKKGANLKKALAPIVGYFANNIVIRSVCRYETILDEIITLTKMNMINGIYENSDITYGEIVQALKPVFDASRNPLFDHLFVFQDEKYQDLTLNECEVGSIETGWGSSRFDLVLELRQTSSGLSGFFEFNTDLFKRETIERMAANYKTLLTHFSIMNTKQKVLQLPLISLMEEKLLRSFNQSPSYDQALCIHQIFENMAVTRPEKTALVFEDSRLTYSELNKAANSLAHHLVKLNVKPNSIVAICMQRSLEAEIAWLGILKAGCAVLFLEDAVIEKAVVHKKLKAIAPTITLIDEITKANFFPESSLEELPSQLIVYSSLNDSVSDKDLNYSCDIDSLALIALTSGSTGEPKGVMVKHRGWSNWVSYFMTHGYDFCIDENANVFEGAPYIFDASLWERLLAYGLGGTLYVNNSIQLRDPTALNHLFNKENITTATFTPSFLATLNPREFASLKCIFVIGEALNNELIRQWKEALPELKFINGYGPTEVTAGATVYFCEIDQPVLIGKPIDNMTVNILDPMQNSVPVGVFGEIYIGGVGLAAGYYNNAIKTQEAFIQDPHSLTEKRLYRTGDLARFLSDGNIEFKGRINSNQIKLHGVRIELEEIETISRQHPKIVNAFVKLWDDSYLAAYLITKDQVEIDDYQQFLRTKGLSTIKVPTFVVYITDVPLTKTGKLDRAALPKPEQKLIFKLNERPPTKTEKKLLIIWSELLRYKEISIRDSFREVGGDSINLVNLLGRINLEFSLNKKKLTLSDLPHDFTVNQLAYFIDKLKVVKKHDSTRTGSSMDHLVVSFYSRF